ncbi:MAG: Trp biosynthesis-associated membrane protein [Actinomycetales bacterium]|jgi:hypothetical protein
MADVGTPRWARKSSTILAGVVTALAAFATTTQTWVHVKLAQGVVQQADLNIAGSKAATAVTALALVALAGALAASIAGKVARIIIAVVMLLAAAGIVASGAAVLADPQGAASGAVGAATGVTGQATAASVTVFPWLAVVAGVLLAAASVLVVLAGRHWKQRVSKYETAAPAAGGAAVPGAEDASAPAPAPGVTDPAAAAAAREAEPLDDIDSWDQLSHGTDPTL